MKSKSMDKVNTYEAVAETSVLHGNDDDLAVVAFYHGLYAMEAAGAVDLKVKARIQVPSAGEKTYMARLKQNLREKSKKEGIAKVEIETAVNEAILVSQAIVTVSGIREKRNIDSKESEKKEIIMTKWAGMEGMLRILSEKKEELSAHFAPAFLREAQNFDIRPKKIKEIEAVREAGADLVLHLGSGGILGALWRLAECNGTGMEVEMKQIPVLQQTIEICEYFRLNPYQLTSAGCFLFTVDDGEQAVKSLEEKGIPARRIGRTIQGKGKIIRNGEEIRYLDRPAPDEIYKIFDQTDKGHH